jgi:hypothetical protein
MFGDRREVVRGKDSREKLGEGINILADTVTLGGAIDGYDLFIKKK